VSDMFCVLGAAVIARNYRKFLFWNWQSLNFRQRS
jgi:hypothetical protein